MTNMKRAIGPAGAPWIVEGGGVERPAPSSSTDLAALLPGLAADVATARERINEGTPGGRAAYRIAKVAELLAEERDCLSVYLAAHYPEERLVEGDVLIDIPVRLMDELRTVRARVAELEARTFPDAPPPTLDKVVRDANVRLLARAEEAERRVAELEAERRGRRGRCATCSEFGVKVSDDGRLVYLWGEAEEEQALSAEMSRLIIERQGAPDHDRAALLATLGRCPVEVLRAVAEVVAVDVAGLVGPEMSLGAIGDAIDRVGDGCEDETQRQSLAKMGALCLAGLQACAPAPGREEGPVAPPSIRTFYGLRTACHAGRDGECAWKWCPQERNGRAGWKNHCVLDVDEDGSPEKQTAKDEELHRIEAMMAADTAPDGDAAKGGAT